MNILDMGKFLSKPNHFQNTQEQFKLQLQNFFKNARDVYTRRGEGTSIWAVPSKYVVTSEGIDKKAFFDPADDKPIVILLLPNS